MVLIHFAFSLIYPTYIPREGLDTSICGRDGGATLLWHPVPHFEKRCHKCHTLWHPYPISRFGSLIFIRFRGLGRGSTTLDLLLILFWRYHTEYVLRWVICLQVHLLSCWIVSFRFWWILADGGLDFGVLGPTRGQWRHPKCIHKTLV